MRLNQSQGLGEGFRIGGRPILPHLHKEKFFSPNPFLSLQVVSLSKMQTNNIHSTNTFWILTADTIQRAVDISQQTKI